MKLEYLIVLAICIAGPLALSFSKKLVFYRLPMRLLFSILIPMSFFIGWDFIATDRGHWSFNEKYITGVYIFNLPVEEVLFFIVIPFCALFSWEVVKYYSGRRR